MKEEEKREQGKKKVVEVDYNVQSCGIKKRKE